MLEVGKKGNSMAREPTTLDLEKYERECGIMALELGLISNFICFEWGFGVLGFWGSIRRKITRAYIV